MRTLRSLSSTHFSDKVTVLCFGAMCFVLGMLIGPRGQHFIVANAPTAALLLGTEVAALTASNRCPYVSETTLWREAIQRQQQFCIQLENLHGNTVPTKVKIDDQKTLIRLDNVQGGYHSIYVLDGDDVVSKIFKETKHWEKGEVTAVVNQLIAVSEKQDIPCSDVVFIDIGANLGTFTVAAAAAGFQVYAFEPMETNIAAIRHSICANKQFIDRVALIETGLGKEFQTCGLYSGNTNVGDGFVNCNPNFRIDTPEMLEKNLSKRQDLIVRRLDNLLDASVIESLKTRVAVLKIDVEGFEPLVFEGAKKFLDVVHPMFIMTEVNSNNLDEMKKYLEYMSGWYEVHEGGFNGPVLELSTLKDPAQGGRNFVQKVFNLYLVGKSV